MLSGGRGSWAALRCWVDEHGSWDLTLLFADTNGEDPDLHRFLAECAVDLGAPLVALDNGGRTVWDVFRRERMIGNTRLSVCSRDLKQRPARRWCEANAPGATVIMGIDWTETHRTAAIEANWAPFPVAFPLVEAGYGPEKIAEMLGAAGIEEPSLYAKGFPHNNCAGACVRAGQGQWLLLLETDPVRYAQEEAQEEAFRTEVGKDVAILRDRRGGTTKPLPLRVLRERAQAGGDVDREDLGGCGCMTEYVR